MKWENTDDVIDETNDTSLFQDEVNSQAFIRFPKGVHSDLKLKAILRKYRQLPGIASVRYVPAFASL